MTRFAFNFRPGDQDMEIDESIARKVLEVVDVGLVSGLGVPEPGKMCVEAAVCYAMGLPHSDKPSCVSPALRALKIRLNDAAWSSREARAQGLRRLAIAQLGSSGVLNEQTFKNRLAGHALRVSAPQALRAAASVCQNSKHKTALLSAALRCEEEGTLDAATAAANAAYAAPWAAAAAAVAYAAAYAAADAAAADAAAAVAAAVAYAATDAAAVHAADKGRVIDQILAKYAETVVQILIDLKAPGCQWLFLAPLEAA